MLQSNWKSSSFTQTSPIKISTVVQRDHIFINTMALKIHSCKIFEKAAEGVWNEQLFFRYHRKTLMLRAMTTTVMEGLTNKKTLELLRGIAPAGVARAVRLKLAFVAAKCSNSDTRLINCAPQASLSLSQVTFARLLKRKVNHSRDLHNQANSSICAHLRC